MDGKSWSKFYNGFKHCIRLGKNIFEACMFKTYQSLHVDHSTVNIPICFLLQQLALNNHPETYRNDKIVHAQIARAMALLRSFLQWSNTTCFSVTTLLKTQQSNLATVSIICKVVVFFFLFFWILFSNFLDFKHIFVYTEHMGHLGGSCSWLENIKTL